MKVLVINVGSSSIKFKIYKNDGNVIVEGSLQRIGIANEAFKKVDEKRKNLLERYIYVNNLFSICTINYKCQFIEEHPIILTYNEGFKWIAENIIKHSIIDSFDQIDMVGFRIVSGGNIFENSVELTLENIKKLKEIIDFAPIHITRVLEVIEEAKNIFYCSKLYAVFDNIFHNTIKEDAYMYAIPYSWYTKYGIRKYGAHGLSYQYVANRCKKIIPKHENVIICHLGQGSSVCALKNLVSVETSMGLTPLDGVPMGTRCGSIDPSIINMIFKKENKSIEEIINILNYKSGLYGISKKSSDIADIIDSNNIDCVLAIKVLVKRIVDYIGSYYLYLGGLDAIVFTGGVGVKCQKIRELIIEKLKCLNIKLDYEKNRICSSEMNVTGCKSNADVYVIPSDEEYCIYKEYEKVMGVGNEF